MAFCTDCFTGSRKMAARLRPIFCEVRIVKDNGDDTFDIEWVEDDAEATVDLADLRQGAGDAWEIRMWSHNSFWSRLEVGLDSLVAVYTACHI